MSDSDSFIDEVSEELRRDRLFTTFRRYGWIAIGVVVLIVAGASWNEWRKAQQTAKAQALGDSILTALQEDDSSARVSALDQVSPETAGGAAVLEMLKAAEQSQAGDDDGAAQTYASIAQDGDLPKIYRDIALYKSLTRAGTTMAADERRVQLEALAAPGNALRLLAEEQLALIEIEEGQKDAALDRLRRILDDVELTSGLRLRASQLIVALGGELTQTQNG